MTTFRLLLALVFSALPITSAYADFNAQESKRRPFVVSPVQEVALGERAVARFLQEHRLSSNTGLTSRVTRIGLEVAQVGDRPSLPYRFLVIKGTELQAYSFPGGTLCLTESLVSLFSSDDELAFALGHELAHTALRHQISQTEVRDALTANTNGEETLIDVVSGFLERDDELEADRFGALYAHRAGFKFSSSIEALKRLSGEPGKLKEQGPHPSYEERLNALQKFRAELELSIKAFDDALKAYDRKQFGEAINLLSLFLAEFPNSVAGSVNLGITYLSRARLDAGNPGGLAEVLKPLLDHGMDIRGDDDPVDIRMARAYFETAIRVQPDHAVALAGLGLIHLRHRQFVDARGLLEKAIESNPSLWDAYLVMGNLEYLMGNYAAAILQYELGLSIESGSPELLKNLAMASEKAGDLDKARDLWQGLLDHPFIGEKARNQLATLTGEN